MNRSAHHFSSLISWRKHLILNMHFKIMGIQSLASTVYQIRKGYPATVSHGCSTKCLEIAGVLQVLFTGQTDAKTTDSTGTVSGTVSARNNVGPVRSRNVFCSGARTCDSPYRKLVCGPWGKVGSSKERVRTADERKSVPNTCSLHPTGRASGNSPSILATANDPGENRPPAITLSRPWPPMKLSPHRCRRRRLEQERC